jgi:hypothetical protein
VTPETAKSYSPPTESVKKRRVRREAKVAAGGEATSSGLFLQSPPAGFWKVNHEAKDAAGGEANSSGSSEEKKVVERLGTRKRKSLRSFDPDEEEPTEKVVIE